MSICMVVDHKSDFSPGNNSNANPIGSNSPPTPQDPYSLHSVSLQPFDVAQTATQKMVNSKDEPRSSSRGNPQCEDIRNVMHNGSQQQRAYPISTLKTQIRLLDIKFSFSV